MDHEFKVGDRATIVSKSHSRAGQTGTITQTGYWISLKVESGICQLENWELRLAPKAGDRVRVSKKLGTFGGQEGTVSVVISNRVRVEFGDDNFGTFDSLDLEVIDPAPAKRSTGNPIAAEDVKVGDKISVTVKERTSPDIEKVSTISAVVGKVVPQKNGNIDFQTSGGSVIFYSDGGAAEIVLLESIEDDPMYRDLSSMGPGSVIVFANRPGEPETDMAIKQPWEDQWHLVDGSKDRKPRTVGLVNIIKKKGVKYTVIRRFEQKED